MNRLEAKIRDYIAEDITFLSEDFELIKVEYHLENAFGTRGFVDILAQDSLRNFVIIEIKRSNQAARQTIQEVLKYAALLKQTMNVRESEIRICIVSTVWDELLVPFSEYVRISQYPIDGYRILLDQKMIPVEREIIKPLVSSRSREFSTNHMAFLFQDSEKLRKATGLLKERLINQGILDFVVLHLEHSGPTNTVIYPYSLYLAFQRYDLDYLKEVAKTSDDLLGYFPYLEEDAENCADPAYLYEQYILGNLGVDFCDDIEVSYPDKLMSLIKIQGWKVTHIEREGFFAKDPRLTKGEIIISELTGTKGGWHTQYHNYSPSKFELRVQEIETQSLVCLENEGKNVWYEHVRFAFEDLKQCLGSYEIAVDVFNPKYGILQTLYEMYNSDPILFLPNYILQVHFSDEQKRSKMYVGKIRWSGRTIAFQELVESVLENDLFSYLQSTTFFQITTESEMRVMQVLGLEYVSNVYFLAGGRICEKSVLRETEEGQVYHSELQDSLYLEDFLLQSRVFLDELTVAFNSLTWRPDIYDNGR